MRSGDALDGVACVLAVLVEEVLGALVGHLPCLRFCPKLIICDWYKLRDAGSKYRAGQVSFFCKVSLVSWGAPFLNCRGHLCQIAPDHAAKYLEYIARLRVLCQSGSGSVMEGAQLVVR